MSQAIFKDSTFVYSSFSKDSPFFFNSDSDFDLLPFLFLLGLSAFLIFFDYFLFTESGFGPKAIFLFYPMLYLFEVKKVEILTRITLSPILFSSSSPYVSLVSKTLRFQTFNPSKTAFPVLSVRSSIALSIIKL